MSNIYMSIPDVQGSVTTEGYQNAIALHSVDFNSEREIQLRVGSGDNREVSIPYFSEVTITKSLDKSTNTLFQSLCNSKNIPQLEIHVCSTDATHQPYVKYTLSNVMIAQHSHSVVAEGKPVERLRLNYTQMQIAFIGRDVSNTPESQTVTGYNLATAQLS